MATITQTVEETLTFTAKPPQKLKKIQLQETECDPYEKQNFKSQVCPPGREEFKTSEPKQCPPGCEECKKSQAQVCPPGCVACKQQTSKTVPLLFNAVGIVIAILATYLMISTDSNLYLVFWVCYSVLRRLMTKSKTHLKTE